MLPRSTWPEDCWVEEKDEKHIFQKWMFSLEHTIEIGLRSVREVIVHRSLSGHKEPSAGQKPWATGLRRLRRCA
jgi:hypothetical protein